MVIFMINKILKICIRIEMTQVRQIKKVIRNNYFKSMKMRKCRSFRQTKIQINKKKSKFLIKLIKFNKKINS